MLFEDMEFGPYDKAERKARRAFELYEQGDISQALLVLEDALQINPSNSAWHFNKALALDAINRFEEAINEYKIALDMNPLDVEVLNSLAVDYTRSGQYDLAIATFEQIQQLDPNFEPCYCNRIITYTEMGQHDLAEQMFYLAQQIEPDCALCYYNIGNSLFIRGQYKKAVSCWLKTAELEPTHPQINYRIAQACWANGDFEHCRQHFLAELRINPGDVEVISDFGLLLLQVGDIESAREKFNRVLELDPNFPGALFYLGEIAFDNADYTEAVNFFDKAMNENSGMQGPRYRLAQYELIKGNKNKAGIYLASELQLQPAAPDVLVSMATMSLAIGDLDLSTNCLLKAIETDTSNPDAYYYLGLVNALKNRFDDAAELFAHTLDIKSDHIPALRDSAVIYLLTGKLDKATERVKKALALASNNQQLKIISRQIRCAQAAKRLANFFRSFVFSS